MEKHHLYWESHRKTIFCGNRLFGTSKLNFNEQKGNLCDTTFETSVERLRIQFPGVNVHTTSILLEKKAIN